MSHGSNRRGQLHVNPSNKCVDNTGSKTEIKQWGPLVRVATLTSLPGLRAAEQVKPLVAGTAASIYELQWRQRRYAFRHFSCAGLRGPWSLLTLRFALLRELIMVSV